jgi:predicted dehydrogenase
MKRREFLQACLSSSALAAAPLPLTGAEPGVARPRIPVGFLGATYSHGPDKIKIVTSSPDWEFVGVCDDTRAGQRACETLGVKRVPLTELLQQARVVAVESDVRDHAAHAMVALKAGKHVHLEKPPAMKLPDVEAVIAFAREKNLLLQSGFMWRYHPGFHAIFEAARGLE